MTSLAVTRTVPRSAAASPDAVRANASAAAAIASACGVKASAAGVGVSPRRERVNSGEPSATSSASMWRPTVGCVSPSWRAAPDRLPSRATAMKVRNASQSGAIFCIIRKCISARHKYAITFMAPGR